MISISIVLGIFAIFYPLRCVRYKKNKCSITNAVFPLYTIMSYRDKVEKKNSDDNSVQPATHNCFKTNKKYCPKKNTIFKTISTKLLSLYKTC